MFCAAVASPASAQTSRRTHTPNPQLYKRSPHNHTQLPHLRPTTSHTPAARQATHQPQHTTCPANAHELHALDRGSAQGGRSSICAKLFGRHRRGPMMSEAGPVYVPSLRPLSRLEHSEMEGYDEVCCNLKCSMYPAPHRSRLSLSRLEG